MIREEILHRFDGFFSVKKSEIVTMDVSVLYDLAVEDSPLRTEEPDNVIKREAIFSEDSYDKNPRLKILRDTWDISKCEPIDLKKEGSYLFIDNGFHRIRVAHDLGLKTLLVNLQEGDFHLSKHISLFDMIHLLDVMKTLFKSYPTFESLQEYLKSETVDQEKIKHIFIGYGYT